MSSIRTRVTVWTVLVLAIPLAVLAAFAPGLMRAYLVNEARVGAEQVLKQEDCFLRAGHTVQTFAVDRAQSPQLLAAIPCERRVTLVADDGTLATDPSRLLSLWPFGKQEPGAVQSQPVGELLTAAGAVPTSTSPLTAQQATLNTWTLSLMGGLLLVLALVALGTWLILGRVLRPVGHIRGQLAEFSTHDLTRRVPVPRRRDEMRDLAETANDTLDRLSRAVEAQRQFVADAAHELRSPIAALRGELELALAHPANTEWAQVVHQALADTIRLQNLAADLLLLARLENPSPDGSESVDLALVVRERLAHRRRPVEADLPEEPLVVRGNELRLARLLDNLLDNAERHATERIAVTLTATAEEVLLEVADDGPGIPEADRERVFDRFTRLDDARDRSHGGVGLGLAIARGIATTHGGTLTLADGPATRFQARLPR
ncbi:signal transduction histidine kinase [Crossiella equi]|uniref:histidine kinase n=1 Tax=Crossiella equi TaxID=130796 RepID=A0ABS5A849_9PSEU|nr:HAMP domain-containing sensor histidine kinase [Crossiella equi]MBP2472770.1 signal transduction histidine kinase [Crossiella equi]